MRRELCPRSERGASGVEYAIVVGAISIVLMIAAATLGLNVQAGLCTAGRALGGTQNCNFAASAASPSPTASESPTATGGSGGGTTGSGSGTTPADPDTTTEPGTGPGTNASGSGASASASPSAAATSNSAGSQQFYLATIDQDQKVADLSIRFNVGWQPSNWNNVTYPTTTVVDVTWSPALAVDQVIPGSDGDWAYVLVAPGHLRLIRTGAFDASGFQPEPEILLKKPSTSVTVTATFAVTTANTAALSATASTRSVPYN